MRIYHGDIISCDEKNSLYQYLAEDKGRIAFLGNVLPEKYAALPITELGTGALLPAFTDTHMHLSSYAIFAATTDIKGVTSHEELLSALKDYDKRKKPPFIFSFGASAHSVSEKRLISRSELDAAFPDKPVLIVCYDGHSCLINTKMRDIMPREIYNIRGFDAESGYITRDAYFAAVNCVTGKIPLTALVDNLARAYDLMAANGIGMVHAAEGVGFTMDLDITLSSRVARGQKSGFQTRMFFQTRELAKIKRRGFPRVGGCFAAALDGCFGCCDAAMMEPYEGTDNMGIMYREEAEVRDFVLSAHREGLQVELHCIGDQAAEIFIGAVENAQKQFPRDDTRHTMIHADLTNDQQKRRIVDAGIHLSRQPYFLDWNLEPPEYYRSIMGEREKKLSPYKKELAMGMRIAGGSDAPVTNPEPMKAIHKLLNRPDPDDNITIEQALRMYTYEGAAISFDEKERGTLETGKIADFAILDKNPMKIPAAELKDVQCTGLILSGKPYEKGQSGFGALLRSFGRGGKL